MVSLISMPREGTAVNIPLYQVDAFTNEIFKGNPAAVCPLEHWLEDRTLQSIALENNLSETAFLVREDEDYAIRWFTPSVEVDLCGHATLASAYVVFEKLEPGRAQVTFSSKSGALHVRRDGDRLALDFPTRAATICETPPGLVQALRAEPTSVLEGIDYLAVFENETAVRQLKPDFRRLMDLDHQGVIVTAPGDDVDFVSRYFVPKCGIDEDPVTGSAHCTLTPYWAERLGKCELRARQISRRGGELWCTARDNRVELAGQATLYLIGEIRV